MRNLSLVGLKIGFKINSTERYCRSVSQSHPGIVYQTLSRTHHPFDKTNNQEIYYEDPLSLSPCQTEHFFLHTYSTDG